MTTLGTSTRHGEREVTLVDGTPVSSYSPAWLKECGERELAVREVYGLVAAESRIPVWIDRLGGGAECERRLRAALHDWFVRKDLEREAFKTLGMIDKATRLRYAEDITARYGPDAGPALRQRVLELWELQRAA